MKHTFERVLIKVDLDSKNSHTFSDGTKIILDRDIENLNKRETMPVNAEVVSADNVPRGAQILIHHNSIHDSNRVFDAGDKKGELYYSIPERECYLWKQKDETEWKPLAGFAIALRVFEPYKGALEGVEPTLIKGVLYICSGELKGKVCHVVKAADYEIVFQGDDGKEKRIIRLRHFEKEYNEREEITAISNILTEKVKKGELLVGLTANKAEKI